MKEVRAAAQSDKAAMPGIEQLDEGTAKTKLGHPDSEENVAGTADDEGARMSVYVGWLGNETVGETDDCKVTTLVVLRVL